MISKTNFLTYHIILLAFLNIVTFQCCKLEILFMADLHLTDWFFIHMIVYCQILPQQDLNETGNYYFTKKPPFQTCISYVPSCHYHQSKYIHSKKGVGLRTPNANYHLLRRGFSHLVTSIHFGSSLCLLQSWLLVAISCTNKCNPTQILSDSICNQRYGATPSFGIYRLIGLAPLG